MIATAKLHNKKAITVTLTEFVINKLENIHSV